MENNTTNDKHIHGDVQDPNVTEATTPLDDASCCACGLNDVMSRNINEAIKSGGYVDQADIDECIKREVVNTLKSYGLI
jgi:hypothetical protein